MKFSRLPRMIVLAFGVALQPACVQLAEVNSTQAPLYAAMIGRTYELREDFVARAFQRVAQRAPDFDHVAIMPPPGVGGHLVLDWGRVPAGSQFRIVGVVSRRSELFPKDEYVISFNDPVALRPTSKPIRIYHVYAYKLYVKATSPGQPPQLNDRYFRRMSGVEK